MILYETTFIVNPQSDDAVIEEKVKAVGDLITTDGGKIVREDRLGTRRLAYPINKLHQGYYASFLHESEKTIIPILDKHIKLGEEYMRHLTIRFEADPEVVYGDNKEEKVPRHAGSDRKGSESKKPAVDTTASEEADSGDATAEIKIAPTEEKAETAEIKIAPTEEKAETVEKEKAETVKEEKPSVNQPEDEEL